MYGKSKSRKSWWKKTQTKQHYFTFMFIFLERKTEVYFLFYLKSVEICCLATKTPNNAERIYFCFIKVLSIFNFFALSYHYPLYSTNWRYCILYIIFLPFLNKIYIYIYLKASRFICFLFVFKYAGMVKERKKDNNFFLFLTA